MIPWHEIDRYKPAPPPVKRRPGPGRPSSVRPQDFAWILRRVGEDGAILRECFSPFSRWSLWRYCRKHRQARLLLVEAYNRRSDLWRIKGGRSRRGKSFRNPQSRSGRRTRPLPKWRPEFVYQVGISVRMTARNLGVAPSTVQAWAKRFPDFHQALVRARIEREVGLDESKLARLERRLRRAHVLV
jgi:hypothetical protein